MTSLRKNHLDGQTSPYLLQHVHNPVDWYPWGPEALNRAAALERPILLSIGYAACHWCHVMEHESFVDVHISQLMNAHYVCIKVDREERPDIDSIYMAATQATNQGRGGWPMTVFLTPEQKPFFAGTYFPPHDTHNLPGFGRLLTHLAHLWTHRRAELEQQAQTLTQALITSHCQAPAKGALDSAAWMHKAVRRLTDDFDPKFGGFGPAPKFPHTTGLRLLMAYSHWQRDPTAQQLVSQTLVAMATGGMYDLIGGGFSRYSVDRRWHVPHFEKMLYDNALLAEVYAEAYALFDNCVFARIAQQTLDFVLLELTHDSGGFYAALDADSQGVEGKFYVWSKSQVHQALEGMPAEAVEGVCAYLDITEAGNWEAGANIARAAQSFEHVALGLGVAEAQLIAWWKQARPKLYAARSARVWPSLDYKILTAWNGLMLSALAAGARRLGEPKYLVAAERAAAFLFATMRRQNGRLWRSFGGRAPELNAYLEDYAFLAEGLLNVYEAGGQARWLHWAQALAQILLTDFFDAASGVFLDTAHDHEALLWRSRQGYDGATPNAHATASSVLGRLAVHTRLQTFQTAAECAVAAYADAIGQSPHAYAKLVLTAEVLRRGSLEICVLLPDVPAASAVDSQPVDRTDDALWVHVQRHYEPAAVLVHAVAADGATHATQPLLQHKAVAGGKTTVYLCRDKTCSPPLNTVSQWQARVE